MNRITILVGIWLTLLGCASCAESITELPMKKAVIRYAVADFRWHFFDENAIKAMEKKGTVFIDDTGMLRGGTWETSSGKALRDLLKELYSLRERSFRTDHFLILVERDRILRVRFRSFDEIPEDIVLQAGDVIILYHFS